MFTGIRALTTLGVGIILAGAALAEDVNPAAKPAATPAAEAAVNDATPEAGAAGEQTQKAPLPNPGPQPFTGTGVVLINPENTGESMLLVQIMVPAQDGKSRPQVVGLPLKADENSAKLVKDFGVIAAKPDDAEGSKKAEAEARQKFVQVEGTLNFEDSGPVLTVAKYAKPAAPEAAPAEPAKETATPAAATPATPAK